MAELASFADKLNYLFATIPSPTHKSYSNDDVAVAINSRGSDATISATYLWMLRKGQRDNPTLKHVEVLARFFGVPPAYFFDDTVTQSVAAEIKTISALRDLDVERVALRAVGLSTRSLDSLVDIIDRIRELEGLQNVEDPTSRKPPGVE